jgi:hypothetical protein
VELEARRTTQAEGPHPAPPLASATPSPSPLTAPHSPSRHRGLQDRECRVGLRSKSEDAGRNREGSRGARLRLMAAGAVQGGSVVHQDLPVNIPREVAHEHLSQWPAGCQVRSGRAAEGGGRESAHDARVAHFPWRQRCVRWLPIWEGVLNKDGTAGGTSSGRRADLQHESRRVQSKVRSLANLAAASATCQPAAAARRSQTGPPRRASPTGCLGAPAATAPPRPRPLAHARTRAAGRGGGSRRSASRWRAGGRG